MTRRERERLRQREELLEAALELFAERGFHNVTMQEIARKAEFAVGTLYRFFRDKEDLYKALVRSRAERYHARMKEVLEQARGGDPREALKRYLEAKAALITGGAPMLRLYFAETRGASFNIRAGLDKEMRKLHDDMIRRLAEVFRRGIRKRIFRNFDPESMAVALESLTNGFLQCWIEDPKRHPFEANVPLILAIFCHGVLKQPAPEGLKG